MTNTPKRRLPNEGDHDTKWTEAPALSSTLLDPEFDAVDEEFVRWRWPEHGERTDA
jgi:hypothetical protein